MPEFVYVVGDIDDDELRRWLQIAVAIVRVLTSADGAG
jgi:hypothetical protein